MAPLTRTNQALSIPQEKSYDVVASVYDQSAILQLADVRQMAAAVEDVVTAGAFTFPAGMSNVAELGVKPSMDGTLASYQLVAQKMAVFVIVSDELLAESAIDIIDFYQDAIEQQMAKLIDTHAILGGGPFGTENLAAASTAAGGNHVVVETSDRSKDLSKMLTAIEDEDLSPNGFLSARRLKSELRDLRDTNNRPLYLDSLTSDTPDQIYGEPIYYLGRGVFPNGLNDVQAIAGDFSQYLVGIRDELTFSLHNEGTVGTTNLLEQNAVALRAEMRIGAKVISNKAFARLNNPAA